ncbi:hypothetical protein BJF79_35305 [Actinomadura sp. CNU-125]|nr:hypothetical protein BJF79_35305 [Actinomadura sp. CNU-125]
MFFALAFLVAIFGTAGVLGFAMLDNRLNPPDYDAPEPGASRSRSRTAPAAWRSRRRSRSTTSSRAPARS